MGGIWRVREVLGVSVRFSVVIVWLVERLHIDLCRVTGSSCR
ncbi:putative leader peptide [Nonomuraea longicatena]